MITFKYHGILLHFRSSMPIVLFTLYQRDTQEGILRHFESVIKTLLDNKTLLSVWKMPVRDCPFFPTDFKIRTVFGILLTHPSPKSEQTQKNKKSA